MQLRISVLIVIAFFLVSMLVIEIMDDKIYPTLFWKEKFKDIITRDQYQKQNQAKNISVKGMIKEPLHHISTNRYNKTLSFEGLDQNDQTLIRIIQDKFLIQPPTTMDQHNVNLPQQDTSQYGQGKLFLTLFNKQTEGFFIEVGATNGVRLSNTLYIEQRLNWSGILIEPNAEFFAVLQNQKRNAYLFNGCLSIRPVASVEVFFATGVVGGINPHIKRKNWKSQETKVKCVPIYSILKSLNNPTVNLFSLDVEGSEPGVLNTIPWSDVNIYIWLIEYGGYAYRKDAIIPILLRNNYILIGTVKGRDLIFVRNDVKDLYDWEGIKKHEIFIPVEGDNNVVPLRSNQ